MGRITISAFTILYIMSSTMLFAQNPSELERRKQYLEEILAINVPEDHRANISRRISLQDSTWADWLHRTGELPPDFENMPSEPFLPEPLMIDKNGTQINITSVDQWQDKRKDIKEKYQYWVSGHCPSAPSSFQSEIISEHREGNVLVQMVEMRFGPSNKAKMTMELMIPDGSRPLPVYMTQWTHRNWAQLAVERGYIACVYAAADDKDDTQAYQEIYPDYDFTCLMRRAWGASRAVDYLYTRPEVDKEKIAITGHSRNGKQSLWAAAFDDRITAVITSSCGTGGITPWRFSDPQYCNQTLDDITANAAHWFHPRLRFFFGREDKLPVDQNLMISLIAPRPLLFQYSLIEEQLNPWANEQCYQSVKKVYNFLHAGDKIGVYARLGEHAAMARDLERGLDFLDIQFGRKQYQWDNNLYFDYSFEQWAKTHQEDKQVKNQILPVVLQSKYKDTTRFISDKKRIQYNLEWLLGTLPPQVKPVNIAAAPDYRTDWIEWITKRPAVSDAEVIHLAPYTAMGNHLCGNLYVPKKKKFDDAKIPVIIYLHPYSYAHGYAIGYNKDLTGRGNSHLFQHLINKGFAVLAIDMFGFGTRMLEAQYFYDRFPQWSKMGKMVEDVKACVDAVDAFSFLDNKNIFILGNTIGGTVALIAAAQDTRVSGVAAVASVTPWRTSNRQYESIRSYADAHGFIPRLGWYNDEPAKVSVDYAEIMACIAPRSLMIVAPTLDRYEDKKAVQKSIDAVASLYDVYGRRSSFNVQKPMDINRISWDMADQIADFFRQQMK
ncbi:prolyl oligopeptidase family serine peptidase [Parabacteroides bouchesdurhonensis]|uniref:glucuronyl esterase domain-containing protein n=1 Tax=Parabacteroides bouchesdurhonensis TaxID=1936995 RepID=UPI000C85C99F|nr:prolyl oligopeptidase family serine peptidase [Parabacteroides bouchesdurhonensis]